MSGVRFKLVVLCLWVNAAPVPADTPWWSAFESDALSTLIETGLAAHPEPVAALARVRAAQQYRSEIASGKRPTADLDFALRAGRENTMYTDRRPGDISFTHFQLEG